MVCRVINGKPLQMNNGLWAKLYLIKPTIIDLYLCCSHTRVIKITRLSKLTHRIIYYNLYSKYEYITNVDYTISMNNIIIVF